MKILVIGSENVGKTSLINRFTKGSEPESLKIQQQNLNEKQTTINNTPVKLQIWEHPAIDHRNDNSESVSMMRGVSTVLLIYDRSNKNSFESIKTSFDRLSGRLDAAPTIAIVSAKSDLNSPSEASNETAIEFANEIGAHFVETSAKNNTNVDKLFELVTLKQHIKTQNEPPPHYSPTEKDIISRIQANELALNKLIQDTKEFKTDNPTESFFLKLRYESLKAELTFLKDAAEKCIKGSWVASADIKKHHGIAVALLEKLKPLMSSIKTLEFMPVLDNSPSARSTPVAEEKRLFASSSSTSQTTEPKTDSAPQGSATLFNQKNSPATIPKVSLPSSPFDDPISGEKMTNPMTLSSGHTFDEKSLIAWYTRYPEAQKKQICPITHEKILWADNKPAMFPNKALEAAYELHKSQQSAPPPQASS